MLSATVTQAIEVTAGWINSDVGLEERGNGLFAGVQDSWPLGSSPFDVMVSGEYVLKTGSQTRFYSDSQSGLNEGEAKVLLHCLQPAAFLAYHLPVTQWKPRVYTGASVVLKIKETWDQPAGETDGQYNYENMDFQIHLGFSCMLSPLTLDFRYSLGMMEQLIDQTSNGVLPHKAIAPSLPEGGDKINSYQIGVGYSF